MECKTIKNISEYLEKMAKDKYGLNWIEMLTKSRGTGRER